jgi:hypothetical protein
MTNILYAQAYGNQDARQRKKSPCAYASRITTQTPVSCLEDIKRQQKPKTAKVRAKEKP